MTMHLCFRSFVIEVCAIALLCACVVPAHATTPISITVTEVAPGVYRVRAGEPEAIVPSMVRQPVAAEALTAMPHTSEPGLLHGIKVWSMNRGVRIELPLNSGEVIYGLGLQCKHLEQNGWRRMLFAASGDDDGKGMSHAPVPFYVSTAGYGVLVDSARYLMFSVGEKQRLQNLSELGQAHGPQKSVTNLAELYGPEKRDSTSVYVDVPAARGVDIYVFAGPGMGQAVARYNLFSGGGCLPPLAALGPGYICGTMLDAKAICTIGEQFRLDRIPVTSLGLEPGWQTHAYSSSYRWNLEKFPADFADTIRRQGYDLNLWCQAYIDPESPLLPLLANRYGDFEVWHGVVPDLVDTAARKTFSEFLRENFIRKGIAGFKLDEVDGSCNHQGCNQEWQFPEFTAFPSGADGEQMRNLLGRFGAQAIADAFRQENRRTLGLVRASHAWAAPVPMAIYSDEYNFPDYIRYNLSAGLQGLLWTPEVRDADNQRDWALRVAAAAFSARMLYNGWQFPHFPWQQPNLSANEQNKLLPDDNPYRKITQRFNRLRMMLVPYLYQAYGDYHRKGIAPVRPLVADWPQDSNTWHVDDEWMLGADLLVAPLTNANSFSTYRRQAVDDAKRFQPLNGPCQITAGAPGHNAKDPGCPGRESIELAMDFDGLGIKGARTPLELQAGPCTLRFAYRADAGSAGIRLWTPDGKEISEFHVDELPAVAGWQVGVVRATLPTAGTYALYIGKAHASSGARRIAFRNITLIQRPPQRDSQTGWSREVYLPEGKWRDFWTAAALKGGQHHVVTASPERPPVFVRENTLLPLAEPLMAIDEKTIFTVHLVAYGDHLRPCQLLEDDGQTFDCEKGKWATLTVKPDGTVDRPDHGQPQRYRIAGKAEPPEILSQKLLGTGELRHQFVNDCPWPDDKGVHINAHGGGILYHEGDYYWFGEHKVGGSIGNTAQVGVHCYRSTDLYNWTDAGIALAVSEDPASEIVKGCIIERPKVIYNAATKTFVMWFHLELKDQGYSAARVGVAVSQSPEGPYRYLRSMRPHPGVWPVNADASANVPGLKNDFTGGQMSRDMTLFVDGDATAYQITASEGNSTLHISRLSGDYRDVSKIYARVFPDAFREAPAICKCQGCYWLITSGQSSWAPNAASVAVADSILGPWKVQDNPCEGINPHNGLGPEKTFGGQSTFILPVHGKPGAFIAMFDVWEPGDAIKGRYVWLPITFDHDRLRVTWRETWDLSVFDAAK